QVKSSIFSSCGVPPSGAGWISSGDLLPVDGPFGGAPCGSSLGSAGEPVPESGVLLGFGSSVTGFGSGVVAGGTESTGSGSPVGFVTGGLPVGVEPSGFGSGGLGVGVGSTGRGAAAGDVGSVGLGVGVGSPGLGTPRFAPWAKVRPAFVIRSPAFLRPLKTAATRPSGGLIIDVARSKIDCTSAHINCS